MFDPSRTHVVDSQEINRYDLLCALRANLVVRHEYSNGDALVVQIEPQDFGSGPVQCVCVAYLEHHRSPHASTEKTKQFWTAVGVEYFILRHDIKAIDCFVTRLNSATPQSSMDCGDSLAEIITPQGVPYVGDVK